MAKGSFATLFACAALVALAGCDTVREELGMEKSAPDEFRVVPHAPLSMPPDYSLRPPEPGVARPQEGTPTDQARVAVFGQEQPGTPLPAGTDGADVAFLTAAGADKADPNIRSEVDAETQSLNEADSSFLDSIIFWRETEPAGVVVDPQKEAQRIRETQALGQPVTTGDTPTIVRPERGLLEGLF